MSRFPVRFSDLFRSAFGYKKRKIHLEVSEIVRKNFQIQNINTNQIIPVTYPYHRSSTVAFTYDKVPLIRRLIFGTWMYESIWGGDPFHIHSNSNNTYFSRKSLFHISLNYALINPSLSSRTISPFSGAGFG